MKREKYRKKGIGTMVGIAVAMLLSACGPTEETLVTEPEKEMTDMQGETQGTVEVKVTEAQNEFESGVKAEAETEWTDEVFLNENVFISYPAFEFEDEILEMQLNDQVKEDALRVLEYFDVSVDSDTLDITYEIADITEDWVSITYSGSYMAAVAPYSTGIFYTSNISLESVEHMRAAEVADAEQMAEILAAGEYHVAAASEEVEAAVKSQLSVLSEEEFLTAIKQADFGTESYVSFPEWFSFWSTVQGETQIFLVVPVPHVLGDYAVLNFQTKENY